MTFCLIPTCLYPVIAVAALVSFDIFNKRLLYCIVSGCMSKTNRLRLCVCLFLCLFVCSSVCLLPCLSDYQSVSQPDRQPARPFFLFSTASATPPLLPSSTFPASLATSQSVSQPDR